MKKTLAILIVTLSFSQLLFSNGGPIDYSHFRKTGNIRLLRKANISLIKENLSIKVVGDYTEINVEYHLKNNGKSQKIQYGFPVDAYETAWGGDKGPVFDNSTEFVEYFNIYENSNKIEHCFWVVDSLYKAQMTNIGTYSSQTQWNILRKWYSASIIFNENETKIIRISYKLKNTFKDIHPGFKSIPRYSDRHFTYHLTPSSHWGNGIVEDFHVEIDLNELIKNQFSFHISGIDSLQNLSNVFSYSTKNYDLNKSERIHIHYNNSYPKLSDYYSNNIIPEEAIGSILVSSNNSIKSNLTDQSYSTVWKGKKNDWIEIRFNKIKRKRFNGTIIPTGILILNGNYSNKEAFESSGKINSVRVTINDTIIFNSKPWKGPKGRTIIKLDNPEYKNLDYNQMKSLSTIIADGEAFHTFPTQNNTYVYNNPISKIRIEIIDISEDINSEFSISELIILGR